MARMNFADVENMPQQSSANNQNQVGFFSLKNDGDVAIVRFMHDTTDDFDVMSVHDVKLDNKYRKISCLRNSVYDDIENCPLCAGGYDVKHKFFIHLIEYSQDATTGQIIATPKIWERTLSYAKELKNLLINYGPLSNSLFKVQRNGVTGDMKTKYNIMYCPPTTFPESMYPKIDNPFKDYDVLGTMVMDKNKDELIQFLTMGKFPTKSNTNANSDMNTYDNSSMNNKYHTPIPNYYPSSTPSNMPPTNMPSQTSFMGAGGTDNSMYASEISRPTRYYN